MSDCAICILEPDEIEREILEGILSDEGTLHFFSSSAELISSLSEHLPALIITETIIGEESGYEICEQIKNEYAAYDTAVLFLTSQTSVDERLKGLEAGADDYLFKPYDIIEFSAKIRAAKNRISGKAGLKKQLDLASNTAMQAMSAQSEMGSVLQSVRAMNEASCYESVCEGLFTCLRDYGLGCTIYFMKGEEETYVPTPGRQVSPIETQIISMVREKERIWQSGYRAAYNFHHTSLLVLNMPEDAEKSGRLRDSLCILMEAFDVRIDNLNQQQELTNAHEWQSDVKEVSQLLTAASTRLQTSVENSHTALRELMDDFWELIPRLALEEDQENTMHSLMDKAFENVNNGLDESEKTCAVVGKVIDRLNKM